jgi:hypothetical protein
MRSCSPRRFVIRSVSSLAAMAAPAAAAAAVVACPRPARAESVRFSYQAPASCPNEADFAGTVASDGGRLAPAEGAEARSFQVDLVPGGDRTGTVTGRLVVRDRDGHASTRTIHGARCEEVARSLAVLVSLALEADPAEAAPAESGSPSASPSSASSTTPPQTSAVPAPALDRATWPERDASPAPTDDAVPLPAGWRIGASAQGAVWGLGSGVGVGAAAYVDVVHDVPDLAAFALRIGAEADTTNPNAMGVSRRIIRLDACPWRALASQPWTSSTAEMWACGRFDAGVLSTGDDLPWVAAGASLRARFVERHFFFELEGGVMFPLVKRSSLDGVFPIPAVSAGGGIGVGWYFL